MIPYGLSVMSARHRTSGGGSGYSNYNTITVNSGQVTGMPAVPVK